MNEFHFLRPWWLLAIMPVFLLSWLMRKRHDDAGDWRDFCDQQLLPHILIGTASVRAKWPNWMATLVGVLALLALAGPAWERVPTPVFRNLSAMVIVLDLSALMEATDIKPSRLERAKFKIEDILKSRKDGQTALVAYAGDAFVVTPLTDDSTTITAQMNALSPRIMPEQGTNIGLGLAAAGKLLERTGQKSGDILLITEGEGIENAEGIATTLQLDGFRVSVLGVASKEGAPVPLPDGGFMKDKQGATLISRLDVKPLWDLAQASGGLYHSIDSGSEDVDAILKFVNRHSAPDQQSGSEVHMEIWREGGVWLLPILLAVSLLGFRRGWLLTVVIVSFFPLSKPANAFEWKDLWLTPDQRGSQELNAGDAASAAEHFQDPSWQAVAQYRKGDFVEAEKKLEAFDNPLGNYNRGNALAKQGELEKALTAYDRTLTQKPGDEDTLYNRKLVEEALKKKQEDKKPQDNKKDDKKDPSDSPKKPDGGQNQTPPPKDGDDKKDKDKGKDSKEDNKGQGDSNDQNPPPKSQDKEKPPSGSQEPPKGSDDNHDKPPKPNSADQKDGSGEESPPAETPPPNQGGAPESSKPQGQADKSNTTPDENQQSENQWLNRIPDDPGGLLKRKFYYQYRQRQQNKGLEGSP